MAHLPPRHVADAFEKPLQFVKQTEESNIVEKALALQVLFHVSHAHFRYRFSDTKKDRHASKTSNISFASFDKATFIHT